MTWNMLRRISEEFGKRRKTSGDIFFTGLNQLWKALSGPVVLVLIPLYLTPELQGYWYTIIGLSLLMIFADLGFTNIILQFAAHEFAHLSFTDNGEITGDRERFRKLGSFFIFSIKWAAFAIVIVVPVIAGISWLLLSRKHSDVRWFIPWAIYLAGSVLTFFNNALISFFEGCDLIAVGQRLRLLISIILTLIMCVMLVGHLGLMALAVSTIASSFLGLLLVIFRFRIAIGSFFALKASEHYRWSKEFFPLLWRYAISFASGYFIFQVYTPLMFYYHGAVEAGKVGISIALWTAIFNISNTWITSAVPTINIHVSRKEWKALDGVMFKRLVLSLLTFLAGAGAFFVLYIVLKGRFHMIDRFLDLTSLLLLALAWFMQVIINSMAVYLRSHKQEPLVMPSFLSAIYITVTTLLCAKFLPASYFFLGFISCYLWSVPWIVMIYRAKKREIAQQYG